MSNETITRGEHGRPLWTIRDHQAEAVRRILRAAGCREWTGEHPAGFVVESHDRFRVACVGTGVEAEGLDQHSEEHRYTEVLAAAGYRVLPDPNEDGLQVSPGS